MQYSLCWLLLIPQITGDEFPPPPELTTNVSMAQSPTDEPVFRVLAAAPV